MQNIDMTDDAWNIAISNFNAYQCDLTPMEVGTVFHFNLCLCMYPNVCKLLKSSTLVIA